VPPDIEPPSRRLLAATQTSLLSLITGARAATTPPRPEDLIVGDARASADERLAVYAYMYRARLSEALESQYPRLSALLGHEGFAELTAAFVEDEPSIRPSLRELGRPLPSWLAQRRPGVPAMEALARLEWARADVFDLADDPALTMPALRTWPAERFGELPLRLVTAHRLLTVGGGAARLWDALGASAPSEGPWPLADDTESVVVWREGVAVYHRVVDADERAALELAAVGTTFGVICEALAGTHGAEDAVARAFSWLSTWAADGLLVAPAAVTEAAV
jgi:hypothetical protein